MAGPSACMIIILYTRKPAIDMCIHALYSFPKILNPIQLACILGLGLQYILEIQRI